MSRVVSKRVKLGALEGMIHIRVGILQPGEAHEGDGMTVGGIAETHEFGLGNVPERSFIRAWFDLNARPFARFARDQMALGFKRGSVLRGAELVAVKAAADMRNRITEGLEPELAESTERDKVRRGKRPPYKPLIDRGVLRNSIAGHAFE